MEEHGHKDHRDLDPPTRVPELMITFFGKNVWKMAESADPEIARIGKLGIEMIRTLNKIDKRMMNETLDAHSLTNQLGIPTSIGKIILILEHIADLVDRGYSPMTKVEMAKAVAPAHEFRGLSFQERNIARLIPNAKDWEEIVRGKTWVDLSVEVVHAKLLGLLPRDAFTGLVSPKPADRCNYTVLEIIHNWTARGVQLRL